MVARIVRAFAYGLFSVAFALLLSTRGFSPALIGLILGIALLAGAGLSMLTGLCVRHLGRRMTLISAAALMVLSAVLLGAASTLVLIVLAASLGTLSAGGQEVGPFGAIEQHIVAESGDVRSIAKAFATYNLAGSFALATGALCAGFVPLPAVSWLYAACGLALLVLYATLRAADYATQSAGSEPTTVAIQPVRSSGVAEKLALLFGIDALAGGFVVQSFLVYWLHLHYGAPQAMLGALFFGANVLSGLSFLLAARVSEHIGLLRTMVFTHLPSNVLLCLVPLMPTFGWAAFVLLVRFALSQMDVPTRQAFVMSAVRPDERARAAGLTNAVRPAAAALAPTFSGLALQTAAVGLPFFLAGGLKIAYDLIILAMFSGFDKKGGEE